MKDKAWFAALVIFGLVLVLCVVILTATTADASRTRWVTYKKYVAVVRQRDAARRALVDARTEIEWQNHQMILKDVRTQELVDQILEAGLTPCPSDITP